MFNLLSRVLVMAGGMLLLGGIVGGAADILTDDVPLRLATCGVGGLYLGFVFALAGDLWDRDCSQRSCSQEGDDE